MFLFPGVSQGLLGEPGTNGTDGTPGSIGMPGKKVEHKLDMYYITLYMCSVCVVVVV